MILNSLRRAAALCALAMLLLGSACGGDDDSSTGPDDDENTLEIDPASFVTAIDNTFFPLVPGTVFVYEGESGGDSERNEVEVTHETKVVAGVTCIVVHDRVWVDGDLEEETFDWFAQHENGDVWYFGEDSREMQNGQVVSTEGSWEAGVDGAEPGIVMKDDPKIGDSYRQEYYEDEAEDMAEVIGLNVSLSVPAGSYTGCLQTKEWTPLEPGVEENKFYAPGVGMVREISVSGGGGLDLVEIRRP